MGVTGIGTRVRSLAAVIAGAVRIDRAIVSNPHMQPLSLPPLLLPPLLRQAAQVVRAWSVVVHVACSQ